MFVPPNESGPVTGRTDSDGRYSLASAQNRSGAYEGQYNVCIALYEAGAAKADSLAGQDVPGEVVLGGKTHQSLVPLRYTRPETSGLSATVIRSQPRIDFALTAHSTLGLHANRVCTERHNKVSC